MKHLATMALMLNLGVAGIYAHERHVNMTFSGTAGASAINLQYADTTAGEDNFAGNGNLGSFTFREVENGGSPQQSSTCSGIYLTLSVGAGVLSFQDGSSLILKLKEGADCIDTVELKAHCIRTFEIQSGTGRFKNATGTLTLDETLHSILATSSGAPVFFASEGTIKGTISGVARQEHEEEERQDEQQ